MVRRQRRMCIRDRESAAYLYNPELHVLNFVAEGDFRPAVSGGQDFIHVVPVVLVLVSDQDRFNEFVASRSSTGAPDLRHLIPAWSAYDAGIVSQNINLFCAGIGLATITRAMMNQEELRKAFHLKDSQVILLNNAVGYPIE